MTHWLLDVYYRMDTQFPGNHQIRHYGHTEQQNILTSMSIIDQQDILSTTITIYVNVTRYRSIHTIGSVNRLT